jgi:hypothetical protein
VRLGQKPWENNAEFGMVIYEMAYAWADIRHLSDKAALQQN